MTDTYLSCYAIVASVSIILLGVQLKWFKHSRFMILSSIITLRWWFPVLVVGMWSLGALMLWLLPMWVWLPMWILGFPLGLIMHKVMYEAQRDYTRLATSMARSR